MELNEAQQILNKAGLIAEETEDDFAAQVLEELKRLCEPFTRNSEFDPQDVFDKTYDFYKENYPELSPYKMATEMIARYRFKKKWKEKF